MNIILIVNKEIKIFFIQQCNLTVVGEDRKKNPKNELKDDHPFSHNDPEIQ